VVGARNAPPAPPRILLLKTMDQQTLLDVAQKYGTPLYLYNLQTILEQINNLKKYLNVAENTEFLYAAKANPNPHIIKEIVNQGFGLDAVSLEEAKLGLYCGASSEKIILTENNITDTEMESAHDLGILINIGSLSRLEKFGKKYSGENVCVRLNTEVGGAASHDTNITVSPYSKVGTSVSKITEIKKKEVVKW
jgi:diaminopimelate decarboxylase